MDEHAARRERGTPPPEKWWNIRCEHGFHHNVTPHSCDFGNHPECPYWAWLDEQERLEEQADVAAYDEAKAQDDGTRVSADEAFSETD
ncbi:hypothetical protein PYV02_01490 [Leifsonia sp. H3M29-4]|uniref:hypothetical protein n=1 Tax=Salinibacterium metalliresistens TaxID=3031321 RepID=UPI0023DC7967|nr:hypothetical protein [Salinibacterium metalliresistens]MDF1477752.1 hypothetical protein [Salinibacterium metalliresistens]